jgi:hypothetical protein
LAREKTELKTFNRGLVSPLALARTDLERVGISAETMDNWMPRNLGSMMLRPGKAYIGNTASDNAAKFIPFVFASDTTALLELTNNLMRVWVNDALVSRPSVSTTVTEGDFDAGLANWDDNSDAGGSILTSSLGGETFVRLIGDGTDAAILTQNITVAAGDQNVEHGLLVELASLDYTSHLSGDKPTLRVGLGTWSAAAEDTLVPEVILDSGQHHFSFTPSGDFWIELSNRQNGTAYVKTCDMDASGTLSIQTPWAEADLSNVRWDQSGDVVYVACKDVQPMKIQRYTSDSRAWSVALIEPEQGPLNTINTGATTIAPNALTGQVNLVSTGPLWKSTDVGRLIRLDSDGQTVSALNIATDDTWTNPIKVTGVTTSRIFTVTIASVTDSTITLQRSLTAADGPWESLTPTYTVDNTFTYDDSLDNQIAWYRIGVDTGNLGATDDASNDIDLTLDYPLGSITGYARVYNVPNNTTGQATVLESFGSTDAQLNWYFGAWSTNSGFPTSVALTEGRLAWAGKNKVWLSESDAYEGFNIEAEGDAGPITRTIGSGPVDSVNWMVDTERLLLGTDSKEHSLRASRDDEILTPTNARIKKFGTQGSATVQAVEVDTSALFVQRGGDRLMEARPGAEVVNLGMYATNDLTTFYPEAGDSPIRRIAVQRQPDTRVHCVRADGSVAILLNDKAEQISCWVMHSGGTVEDVIVLPGADGDGEDAVYYVVQRTVNSSTVRFLEKWSLESENQGGATNKNLDAHITGTVSGGTMSGLDHLEGETVAAWVNGVDAGTYVVTSGAITGVTTNGAACVGLAYTAQFKSAKIGMLTDKKNIKRLGVIMRNTHYQGLQYGPDFSSLYNLPKVKDGAATAADTVHPTFDEETFAFGGRWDSDSRLCLQAASPRPVTLLAAIVEYEE